MLRHNLLLIFRNFIRFKNTFFINLIGLSTGLACVLLIYLWVVDELNVDKFNEQDSRLFQAMEYRKKADGIWTAPASSGPLADALIEDMPEVEYASPATMPNTATLSVGDKNIKSTGRFAGKDYFKMFSYTLIQGNEDQVLADKSSIVISDALALKLFNTTENVVGKMIEYQHEEQFQVSGIFKSVPVNASSQFDFVMSFEKYKEGRDYQLGQYRTANLCAFKRRYRCQCL